MFKISIMKKILIFLLIPLILIILFITSITNINKPKTFEPYQVNNTEILNRIKNIFDSIPTINLNEKITYGEDSIIELMDYNEAREIELPFEGKFRSRDQDKILYFHLRVEKLSGEYENHLINSVITALACKKNFDYCYDLSFRSRDPKEGIIKGKGQRDFYILGFLPKNDNPDYIIFYSSISYKTMFGSGLGEASYFAKFKLS